MKSIQFSKNWNNKLSCRYFTTIRRNPYKEGHKIGVLVRGNNVGIAEVITSHRIPAGTKLYDAFMILLATDTGYYEDHALNLFKNLGITIIKDEGDGSYQPQIDMYIILLKWVRIDKGVPTEPL